MTSLFEILATTLKITREQFRNDTGPEDVGSWDSLAHLSLVAALEEAYDLEFDMDEISKMKTIGDIKQILVKYGVSV